MSDESFKKLQEQQVIEHFAACERVRKKLELAPDALPLIDKMLRDQPTYAENPVIKELLRTNAEMLATALRVLDRQCQGLREENAALRAERDKSNPSATTTTRSPLRFLSDKPIKKTDPIAGIPTPLVVRPQTLFMRVEEIEILSKPDEWMIADVQVGKRSQFPQSGPPLPGRLFTPGGTCHHFVTESIQMAMDFTLLVHYVGANPDGEIFVAVAMGSHAL